MNFVLFINCLVYIRNYDLRKENYNKKKEMKLPDTTKLDTSKPNIQLVYIAFKCNCNAVVHHIIPNGFTHGSCYHQKKKSKKIVYTIFIFGNRYAFF